MMSIQEMVDSASRYQLVIEVSVRTHTHIGDRRTNSPFLISFPFTGALKASNVARNVVRHGSSTVGGHQATRTNDKPKLPSDATD